MNCLLRVFVDWVNSEGRSSDVWQRSVTRKEMNPLSKGICVVCVRAEQFVRVGFARLKKEIPKETRNVKLLLGLFSESRFKEKVI